MSDRSSKIVKISPAAGKDVDSVVIWLHGLGDTPHGWAEQCRGLARKLSRTEFVLPTAPSNPVSCNAGYEMTSWMDILEIPIKPSSPDNGKQQEENIAYIHALIREKAKEHSISLDRIVLCGFSQGGALSLASTIRFPKKLGGCVVCSGWALPAANIPKQLKVKNLPSKKTPYLVCHGTRDNVVLPSCGEYVTKMLREGECASVQSEKYEGMAHSSCASEMEDVQDFLLGVLS